MKLLIISNVSGYTWAGSEALWHEAAILGLNEGHEVTAIVHEDLVSSNQICEFQKKGGRVRKWAAIRIARFQKIKEKILPSFPVCDLDKFDAILVSLGSLPSINYVPGLVHGLLKTKSPIVLLCQFNADHLIISTREREVVATMIQKARVIIFVSERNHMEARRQFAVEPKNYKVIQNPIRNHSEISPCWPDLIEACFASVARLEVAWKGQDLLLDVLSQPQWKQRHWKLRFYGEGPDREYLEKLAQFYGLSDRVIFEGQITELNEIWKKNHILVLPSHGEGTPLAALEAIMAGRPVVATDVGGNTDIISNGANGFIAEAATLNSFSHAMERAWEVRDRWKEMGEYGRQNLLSGPARNSAKDIIDICLSVAYKK